MNKLENIKIEDKLNAFDNLLMNGSLKFNYDILKPIMPDVYIPQMPEFERININEEVENQLRELNQTNTSQLNELIELKAVNLSQKQQMKELNDKVSEAKYMQKQAEEKMEEESVQAREDSRKANNLTIGIAIFGAVVAIGCVFLGYYLGNLG